MSHDRILATSNPITDIQTIHTPNYYSFSEPNVYLAQLQTELCRGASIFAAR